ncbi:putative ciliary rootlet coiled-coil protein 2 isoform X2 [Scyliorhinus canicula]|uniref:putative ciliary rootlet coiled-coil protein 2 isoform X2 n=1 Tax=Scyliorhinus canicula TaxID=7830 RepID=UPI0018F5C85E|nr:putative ciliary rootlet coiled-coil protein 2 isoform X2 [Scyliorhinus canicula]
MAGRQQLEYGSAEKMRSSSGKSLKRSILAPNLRTWASEPLSSIETEYIKNLQQQVCLLELETSFLREQAKKAASIPPKITYEAEQMVREMKELQAEIEFIQLEIKKRDARIAMSLSEKELFCRNLHSAQGAHSSEKKLMTEELLQMKKLKEIANRDMADKESEVVKIKQALEKTTAAGTDRGRQVWLLETQHIEKHQATEAQLGEKKSELIKTQVALHQLEENYYCSTASIQDHIAKELRDEISSLQQKLRDRVLLAEEDKFLRNKVAEDCGRLTKENALLHSQVLELTKELEKVQAFRDEKNFKHSTNVTQLTSLKEQERHHELELAYLKKMMEEEEKKVLNAMEQLHCLEQGKSSVELKGLSLRSQLAVLEKRQTNIQLVNTHLKGEKDNLVEHISELHKQISEKDDEILRMKGHVHTLAQDLSSLKSQLKRESSLRSESWKEISSIADTMKQVASTMNKRNVNPTSILNFTKQLY